MHGRVRFASWSPNNDETDADKADQLSQLPSEMGPGPSESESSLHSDGRANGARRKLSPGNIRELSSSATAVVLQDVLQRLSVCKAAIRSDPSNARNEMVSACTLLSLINPFPCAQEATSGSGMSKIGIKAEQSLILAQRSLTLLARTQAKVEIFCAQKQRSLNAAGADPTPTVDPLSPPSPSHLRPEEHAPGRLLVQRPPLTREKPPIPRVKQQGAASVGLKSLQGHRPPGTKPSTTTESRSQKRKSAPIERPNESHGALVNREGFDTIIGSAQAKEALIENVVMPLRCQRSLFVGIRRCGHVMLYGPPGTGKTSLARAAAVEAKARFVAISPSSCLSKYQGESERTIRRIFDTAKSSDQSTVLFFDECESLAPNRSGEDLQAKRLVSELLVQITGLERQISDEGGEPHSRAVQPQIVLIAATNLLADVDPAFLRRFHARIHVGLPSEIDRVALLQKHMSTIEHSVSVCDFYHISVLCQGWSGSDLELLSREAAMKPLRQLFRSIPSVVNSSKDAPERSEAIDETQAAVSNSIGTEVAGSCGSCKETLNFVTAFPSSQAPTQQSETPTKVACESSDGSLEDSSSTPLVSPVTPATVVSPDDDDDSGVNRRLEGVMGAAIELSTVDSTSKSLPSLSLQSSIQLSVAPANRIRPVTIDDYMVAFRNLEPTMGKSKVNCKI